MTAQPTEDFRRPLYERYYTTHAAAEHRECSIPALDRNIRRRLPGDRELDILDIGCGEGHLLGVLRGAGYAHVSGIDVSAEQVQVARGRGFDVVHADALDFLRERPSQFDVITAVDVIEHFEKPDVLSLLEAVSGALKPGGVLVGQVPNGESPFAGRYIYGDLTHGTAFTQRSIAQVLGAAGFVEVQSFPAGPVAHGVASALRVIAWRIVAAAYKAALATETGVLSGHIVTQNLIFRGKRGT